MRDPLLPGAISVCAGIALARTTQFHTWELVFCMAAFSLLAVFGKRFGGRWIPWTGACLALAALGAGVETRQLQAPRPPPATALTTLTGCVVDPPVRAGEKTQLTVEDGDGRRTRVSVAGHQPLLASIGYGNEVSLDVKLRPAVGYRNPGAFDLGAWLARQGVAQSASAGKDSRFELLTGKCGQAWRRWLYSVRTAAARRIDALYPNDGYRAAMMRGLLLGDKSGIEKVWTEDWRRTGTYHALVISGSHVTLVCGLLLLWRRFFGWGERSLLAASAGIAWFYALLAGGDAPVARAAAGFTLFAAAGLFYRRTRILNLLAAVAIAFLLYDPDSLFDASFQLSFLAVAAIGLFQRPRETEPAEQRRAQSRRLELRLLAETLTLLTRAPLTWCESLLRALIQCWHWVWETFRTSAAVQLGLALPMALYFHRLSLTGLTANVLAVPLLSLAIPLGFAALITGWSWVGALAGGLLDASAAVVAWHARLEPDWRIADPPIWLAWALPAAVAAFALCTPRRNLRLGAAAATASLLGLLVWNPFAPAKVRGSLELTGIDVGQGDSFLISLPDGEMILVDAGGIPRFRGGAPGSFDLGEDVVSPYLWTRGVKRLAAVAVTHLHEDHAGGVPAIIANFRPREIWSGFAPEENEAWRGISRRAAAQGSRVRTLKRGDAWRQGGVAFEVLSPAPLQPFGRKPGNNDSLVLRLTYGRHVFLLLGDAERPIEAQLMEAGLTGHVDVMKVSHHGSRRSNESDWLSAMRPSVALISAGFDNIYGLPARETLSGLAERRAVVLRTDLAGLISVQSDGRYLTVGRVDEHNRDWDVPAL
jgi:competence protein ComEC